MDNKDNKKITYSYRFAEYVHETIEMVLFMRNNLLAELICKKLIQSEKNKQTNLQSEGDSRQANLQTAG